MDTASLVTNPRKAHHHVRSSICEMPSIGRHLVYVSDQEPGISRTKDNDDFLYWTPDGQRVMAEDVLNRIDSLGLPPAYSDVWICLDEWGHIQATGLDDAARKQYRYHPSWVEFRDRQKYAELSEFARLLPRIRRKVSRVLRNANRSGKFDKETATAAVVRLMDQTAMRIGGKSETSKGATTLSSKNVRYADGKLRLRYRAKGGKRVQRSIRDSKLQRIMEQIDDLPGRQVFQYFGDDQSVYPLRSEHVNQWLKDVSRSESVSAKVFRTWHGSVAALDAIRRASNPTVKLGCEAAAKRLRNTPAICRKSYIHPKVIALVDLSPEERAEALRIDKVERSRELRVRENQLAYLIR